MFSYIVRRVLLGVLTLTLITFFMYALIRFIPGNPLRLEAGEAASQKETRENYDRMLAAYGLDKPWYVGYCDWLMKAICGDFGTSITQKIGVMRLIGERVGPTLVLSVTSLSLTYLLSVPLGLYMTSRSGAADERVVSTLLYMLYSFPTFVAALLLQIAFAIKLGWLPLGNMQSDDYADLSTWEKVLDVSRHAILPVICETYGVLAYYSRFVNANLQEVIRQDYIRTARAKGVSRFRVLTYHALRNTMIPLITMLGISLPRLLSGAVILEYIFSWPGMGLLYFVSLSMRDYPTIMGLTLIFATLTLLGQLIADVLYAFFDPRVTYS
jgi:peptide/nickel transport system permease protein